MILKTTKKARENEAPVSMRCIYSRRTGRLLAVNCRLNNQRGWRQGSFCFALTGLGFFTHAFPRAALADSLALGYHILPLQGG
jgi:hypothetical protein